MHVLSLMLVSGVLFARCCKKPSFRSFLIASCRGEVGY